MLMSYTFWGRHPQENLTRNGSIQPFFFSINDKNVFINSHYDRFMNQKLCESVYMNHLEIRMLSSLDENLYWLIRVDGAGNVSVLTYHTEDYLGYDEVKEPSIFTAPVLR